MSKTALIRGFNRLAVVAAVAFDGWWSWMYFTDPQTHGRIGPWLFGAIVFPGGFYLACNIAVLAVVWVARGFWPASVGELHDAK
jgi:hypothetical protein